jgi:hypothetical protein
MNIAMIISRTRATLAAAEIPKRPILSCREEAATPEKRAHSSRSANFSGRPLNL